MPTLYVTEPGSQLHKEYQRLQVLSKDEDLLLSVPLSQVSEVVLVGGVGATTQAMLAVLDAGIGLSLVTRSGRLRGRLHGPEAGNLPLRKLQYARSDQPEFCLALSRSIVLGKLANCRTLGLRALRGLRAAQAARLPGLERQMERLTGEMARARQAGSLAELRGLEGSGARAYFAILRATLRWQGEPPFEKRSRRPPKDPVNALLSLGYTLLTDAVFSAAELAGLDPYAGFFHSQEYGRPALVLDLMEEFRPLIVDSVVLTLVNKRMIREQDFEPGREDGFYLNRRGMRIFFRQFTRRLNTQIFHPLARRPISYQKCLEVQARQLRKMVEGSAPAYLPFSTK